jgi:hypothetical protein
MDTTDETPGRRERIGSRAWVRSAGLIGGGLVVGGILAGTISANAAADDPAAPATASAGQEAGVPGDRGGDGHHGHGGGPGDGDPTQSQRDDEVLLTGDTATKVTDAVLADYPDATIQRVESDSDGVYEAHIVTADDAELTVAVGKDFAITGTGSH